MNEEFEIERFQAIVNRQGAGIRELRDQRAAADHLAVMVEHFIRVGVLDADGSAAKALLEYKKVRER